MNLSWLTTKMTDEPMMPGSDDEFSDCELDENLEDESDNDSGDEQSTPPSQLNRIHQHQHFLLTGLPT